MTDQERRTDYTEILQEMDDLDTLAEEHFELTHKAVLAFGTFLAAIILGAICF